MPWKPGYTTSDEKSLTDEEIRWPGDNRCCVSITVDLSVASGPAGITESDLTSPRAQFGAREGLAQIRSALRRFGLRATVAVPAVTAMAQPDAIHALMTDGHEIAAQGLKHEDVSSLDRDDEAARIARSAEILTGITGRAPAGWYSLPRQGDPFAGGTISPHTIDLLIDAGYTYFGNGLADDMPHYWVTDFAARRSMLTLPYYYHYDDQFFLHFPTKGTGLEHADSLLRNWRAEFAAQYRRRRSFHMVLHPFASGFGHRVRLLEDFFQFLRSHDGVWNATGTEIAGYWRGVYPADRFLRLEDPVWRDYPGSLS